MRNLLLLVALGLLVGCAKKGAKDTGASRDDLTKVKVQQAQPVAKNDKKSDKADEPNWLNQKKDQKDQLPADGAVSSGKQPWGVGPPAGGFTAPVPGVLPAQPPGAEPGAQPPFGPGAPAPVGGMNPGAGRLPGGGAPAPGGIPAVAPAPVGGGNAPAGRVPGGNGAPAGGAPVGGAPAGVAPVGGGKRAVTKDDMFNLQVFIHDSSLVRGRMPTAAEVYAALVEAKSPAAELVKDGTIILTGTKERDSIWAFDAGAYINGGFAVSQNGVETLTAAELKRRLGK